VKTDICYLNLALDILSILATIEASKVEKKGIEEIKDKNGVIRFFDHTKNIWVKAKDTIEEGAINTKDHLDYLRNTFEPKEVQGFFNSLTKMLPSLSDDIGKELEKIGHTLVASTDLSGLQSYYYSQASSSYRNIESGDFSIGDVGKFLLSGAITTFLASRFLASDVVIGLAFGEALPLAILSALATTTIVNADNILETIGIELPQEAKTAINVMKLPAILLTGMLLKKAVPTILKKAKFADTKTFSDLKNISKEVQEVENIGKSVVKKLDSVSPELMNKYSIALEYVSKDATDIQKEMLGSVKSLLGTGLNITNKTAKSYIEKGLLAINKEKLIQLGIDPKQVIDRLSKMSNIESVPGHLRQRRMEQIKMFLTRIKEASEFAPDAEKIASARAKQAKISLDIKEYEKMADAFKDNPKMLKVAKQEKLKLESAIAAQEGIIHEQNLGKVWRTNMVKQELKHGDRIDNLMFANTKEDISNAYLQLWQSLEKGKPADLNLAVKDMSDPMIQALIKRVAQESGMSVEEVKKSAYFSYKIGLAPDLSGSEKKAILEEAVADIKELMTTVKGKFDLNLSATGLRPFALDKASETGQQIGGGVINIGTGDVSLVNHEVGHLLEKQIGSGAELSSAFRSARSFNEGGSIFQIPLHPVGEVATRDKFIHSYVGKVYPHKQNMTEVVSMGVENMSSSEKLFSFAHRDPEHLLHTLSYFE
jgi:hypothetical protein